MQQSTPGYLDLDGVGCEYGLGHECECEYEYEYECEYECECDFLHESIHIHRKNIWNFNIQKLRHCVLAYFCE